MAESIKVFICYAHQDRELRDELERHLSSLTRSKQIIIWHDREILPGTEWEKEIDAHLDSANLILLLISSYFLASDYCWGREMKHAIERQKEDPVSFRVLPVILRPVAWKDTPLGELQALPTNGKPVTQWTDLHLAFEDISQGIAKIVSQLQTVTLCIRIAWDNTELDVVISCTAKIGDLIALLSKEVWDVPLQKDKVDVRVIDRENPTISRVLKQKMSIHEAGLENDDILILLAQTVGG